METSVCLKESTVRLCTFFGEANQVTMTNQAPSANVDRRKKLAMNQTVDRSRRERQHFRRYLFGVKQRLLTACRAHLTIHALKFA